MYKYFTIYETIWKLRDIYEQLMLNRQCDRKLYNEYYFIKTENAHTLCSNKTTSKRFNNWNWIERSSGRCRKQPWKGEGEKRNLCNFSVLRFVNSTFEITDPLIYDEDLNPFTLRPPLKIKERLLTLFPYTISKFNIYYLFEYILRNFALKNIVAIVLI